MRQIESHDALVADSSRTMIRHVIRILAYCGLTRDDLLAILDSEAEAFREVTLNDVLPATAGQIVDCSDVVLRWRRDPLFLNASGLPKPLSTTGLDPGFSDLVKRVSSNLHPEQVLSQLASLGAVRILSNETAILVMESIVACSGRDGGAIAPLPVLQHVCGFLGSVSYNLTEKPTRMRGRFERACYASVPAELVPILENLVAERGQDFVDVIDEWLGRKAISSAQSSQAVLVGAGAYVFVHHDKNTKT